MKNKFRDSLKFGVLCALFFSQNIKAYPTHYYGRPQNYRWPQSQNVVYDDEIKPVRSIGLDISSPIYGYSKYGSGWHNYGLHYSKQGDTITTDHDLEFSNCSIKRSNGKKEGLIDINYKFGLSYNFLGKNERHDAAFVGLGIGIDDFALNKDFVFASFFFNVNTGGRVSISKNLYLGATLNFNFGGTMLSGDNGEYSAFEKLKAFPISGGKLKDIIKKELEVEQKKQGMSEEERKAELGEPGIELNKLKTELILLGKEIIEKSYSVSLNFYLGFNIPYSK